MKKIILLGVNGDTIYTGEFEVKRLHEGEKEFSASFNVGFAFDVNNINDRVEDYFEDLWKYSDDGKKLELLQDGEITEAQEEEINNFLNELVPFEEWGTKFEDFIKDNVDFNSYK